MHTVEGIALQIENSQDSELLHAFEGGLKDRVHKKVRLRDPKTLQDTARRALDINEQLYTSQDWQNKCATQQNDKQHPPLPQHNGTLVSS